MACNMIRQPQSYSDVTRMKTRPPANHVECLVTADSIVSVFWASSVQCSM